MAIRGDRFLELNKVERLRITEHALNRAWEHSGHALTHSVANALFLSSRQLPVSEMLLLGYRPAYARRRKQGESSWYFRFRIFGQELIAVISEDANDGRPVWVTTYARNAQTDIYRAVPAGELALA